MAVFGGLFGLGLAYGALRVLVAMAPPGLWSLTEARRSDDGEDTDDLSMIVPFNQASRGLALRYIHSQRHRITVRDCAKRSEGPKLS